VCAGSDFLNARASSHEKALADSRSKGSALAEKLREVLPLGSAEPNQLEPTPERTKENDKEKESRYELLAATSLFNAASSEITEEQHEAEDALREAMSSPSKIGTPDRSVPQSASSACLPDFSQCPKGWAKEGSLCVASSSYGGQCAHEVDFSEMSVEQKLAFASFCSVAFPCQGGCAQDFQQSCPSLWREIGTGVCSAPLQYEGDCASRLETAGMSEEDKYAWSIRCGARWPCAASQKSYEDICPEGWELQFGSVCAAPANYTGPCEQKAHMHGSTLVDKKAFEKTCRVQWAMELSSCAHDHSASCPLGWYQSGSECLAPLGYNVCGGRKDFSGMTPAAKADWAHNCKVEWPCKERRQCKKVYVAPCPAKWYAFNAGASCASPPSYSGDCAHVLHGLVDMTKAEKASVEEKCGFEWPCAGEVYAAVLQVVE